jgi:putative transposase
MMRAYQFRIYPTKDQQHELSKFFGASRYVWNWALRLIKDNFAHTEMLQYSWGCESYEDALTMKFHGCKDTSLAPFKIDAMKCSLLLTPVARRKVDKLPEGMKQYPGLKDLNPWLNEVPDKILRFSLRNLGVAFKNFFKADKNGSHRGYPKSKSLHDHQSIQFQGENVRLDTKTGIMSITGMKGIEVRLHRSIDGKIGTTTISKTKSGKYFVSFQVDDGREMPITKPISRERILGIDVGLLSYITTSDGQKIDGIQAFRESEKRLAVLQRRQSRKQKGSKNSNKARLKVARMHEKIANQRSDFQHKLSRSLVDNHDAIILESLNIKGMIKNHHLAKSISDAGWSEFMRQIKYKADWAGKTVIEISQWEPSSKTCHSCGHKLDKLTLGIREWACPRCGSVHDRDINAAINIKALGMDQLCTCAI